MIPRRAKPGRTHASGLVTIHRPEDQKYADKLAAKFARWDREPSLEDAAEAMSSEHEAEKAATGSNTPLREILDAWSD